MLHKENSAQRQAIEAAGGPIVVTAGPGTGKTKTLTERIAWLVGHKRVPATAILALTFTKKAAEEMQARVGMLVSGAQPKITTFHGICFEILGEATPFVSEAQRLRLIKSLPRPAAFKGLSAKELGLAISNAKNAVACTDTSMAGMVASYTKELHARGLRDFDDLLIDTYEKLQSGVGTPAYPWILVDEFQDTNYLQYAILKLLSASDNLFVIGDPNQSIYGFRGASGNILAEFKADFPTTTEIILTTNYRSAPEIVRLSNAIFPSQPALISPHTSRGQVRAVKVLNEYREADWILGEIQQLIGGSDFAKAVSDDVRTQHRTLREIAILYRNRSAALAIQKVMETSGLPYQVVGDGSPYEKPDVQTVIAVLRELQTGRAYDHSDHELADRHRKEKAAKLLGQHKKLPPADLAAKCIEIMGLPPRSRDLSQLCATLARFTTLRAAVDYFDATAETGFYDPAADAITLVTIHASKGLEFPVVFLAGMEEGILPSKRSDREEEKRLWYVAATRAKERLEITYAANRRDAKTTESSFLGELPIGVLERISDPNMQMQVRQIAKRHAKRSQQSLF